MTTSAWPVVRAWRPFVRRISTWKEALGSSDTEVLARRDALREELASAPSLACDIVGAFVSVVAIGMMVTSLALGNLPSFGLAVAAGTVVWLLPGHRWYLAPLRLFALGAIVAVGNELRPGMMDDAFAPMFAGRLIKPPLETFPLPLALPLLVVGAMIVAVGLRLYAKHAPELPRWAIGAATLAALTVIAASTFDYQRAMTMRLGAHQEFARKVRELREQPQQAIALVRSAITRREISDEATRALSDLEIAFRHDRTLVELRRAVDAIRENEQRARDAQIAREDRMRQAATNRANAVFDSCVRRCVTPYVLCERSGYRSEVCAQTYKNLNQCQAMCLQ